MRGAGPASPPLIASRPCDEIGFGEFAQLFGGLAPATVETATARSKGCPSWRRRLSSFASSSSSSTRDDTTTPAGRGACTNDGLSLVPPGPPRARTGAARSRARDREPLRATTRGAFHDGWLGHQQLGGAGVTGFRSTTGGRSRNRVDRDRFAKRGDARPARRGAWGSMRRVWSSVSRRYWRKPALGRSGRDRLERFSGDCWSHRAGVCGGAVELPVQLEKQPAGGAAMGSRGSRGFRGQTGSSTGASTGAGVCRLAQTGAGASSTTVGCRRRNFRSQALRPSVLHARVRALPSRSSSLEAICATSVWSSHPRGRSGFRRRSKTPPPSLWLNHSRTVSARPMLSTLMWLVTRSPSPSSRHFVRIDLLSTPNSLAS